MSNIFQTVEPFREGVRSSTAKAMAAMYPELSAGAEPETFDFVRMLNDMTLERFDAGSSYEANVCAGAALAQGAQHDKQRAMLPWGAIARIRRDLGTTVPSAGGNLVGTRTPRAVDVLRPYSLVTKLGVQVLERNMQNLVVPRVSSPVTGQWLPTETSAITTSDPVIGVVPSQPKTAGALMKLSRQLVLQGQNANEFIAEQLLACMGEMLDRAVLNGSGVAGEPTGIIQTPGVWGAVLTETISEQHLTAAVSELETQGAAEENIRAVLNPAKKNFLRYLDNLNQWSRGPVWRDGKLVDIPAHSTNRCPMATVIFGDFSKVQVALWGSGLSIEVDPMTSFKTGGIQVRVLMHCDVNVLQPGAFFTITTTT